MLGYFLNFDKLIGTKLIKVLYYIGMIVIFIGGLLSIFQGFRMMGFSVSSGLGTIVMSIIGTVLAIVFWRFMCELYLLFFRMSDDLRDIKNHQLGREANKTDVNIDL